MNIEDIQGLRELAYTLGIALENERTQARAKTQFLKRLVLPEDLGQHVSAEVRNLAYQLLINESDE